MNEQELERWSLRPDRSRPQRAGTENAEDITADEQALNNFKNGMDGPSDAGASISSLLYRHGHRRVAEACSVNGTLVTAQQFETF